MGRLLIGHVLDMLAEIESESVHCCVTSPPYYGLRSYAGNQVAVWGGDPLCPHEWGQESRIRASHQVDFSSSGLKRDGRPEEARTATNQVATETRLAVETRSSNSVCQFCGAWMGAYGSEPTIALYVEHTVAIFREVRRVLKKDGTLWLNLGDSYAGSCKGKGTNGNHGKATIGDDAYGAKSPLSDGLKPKDLMMVPARVAIALQDDGWYLRQDCIWEKPNPMPESVTDRPTTSHEHIFLFSKSERYFYDQEAVREKLSELTIAEGHNLRSVWTFSTQGYKGAHFATFPQELPRRCILAGSPTQVCARCGKGWRRIIEASGGTIGKGSWTPHTHDSEAGMSIQKDISKAGYTRKDLGFRPACTCDAGTTKATILDPFAGSGTTLFVAEELGRDWIGIDISEDYRALIEQRLRTARTPLGLAI